MNTGKVILILLVSVLISMTSYSQIRDEVGFGPAGPPEPARVVQIYPNPAFEVLNIKFETPCAKRIKLSVHNIIGNTVEVEIEPIEENEIQIKVRDLPTGYYLLSLRDPDTNFKSTLKFLKR
jgi:hypothetical protein